MFVTLGFALIGFIDDFKKLVLKNTDGLSPKAKLVALLLVSALFMIYDVNTVGTETYIPFIKEYISIPMYIFIPVGIFIFLGTTNAFNLTDGIDGLATSITIVNAATVAVIANLLGGTDVSIFASIITGTCIGFLFFNLKPAKVFMGDTGSLMLGGIICSSMFLLKIPVMLVFLALIPMLEAVSVIIQVTYYKKTKKRIFKMAPLHHHFELSGWSENLIVFVFTIATLAVSLVAINIIN
jgi:phospho-N-acetylmuramoyl-pentapeptide-transferase